MPHAVRPLLLSMLSLSGMSMLLSCVASPDEGLPAEAIAEAADQVVTVPPKGASSTLDIGEWNIEWFGSTANGPTNEALQLSNVGDVIRGADLDLWVLEEVVSTTQFNQLKTNLPGYDGFLSNDARVTSGGSFYTSTEQKLGILYKSSVVTVQSARLILTANDFDFAGRPPLEVTLTATVDGKTQSLTVIVVHAKAVDDTASYDRRLNASIALKSYLDSTHPSDRVIVAGDFNDDVDTSITVGRPSPYKNFVDDVSRYSFPTKVFSAAGQGTTMSYPDAIDHHLLTNELAALFLAGSAEIFRADQFVPNYGSTTTDHLPTITRYSLGGTLPPSGPAKIVINEILANEPGSNTVGEFVEVLNVGSAAADLSGWTLSDATGVRHTWATGTTIAAGKAVVVFGGALGIPSGSVARWLRPPGG